jgi:AhpD family alkylhydroperoxidase
MADYQKSLEVLSIGMKKLSVEIPSTLRSFNTLISDITKDSVLSGKNKELIALGIAINQRCDSCTLLHIVNALKNKAIPKEIYEVIGVAIVAGGGPAIVMGVKAVEMLENYLSQTNSL